MKRLPFLLVPALVVPAAAAHAQAVPPPDATPVVAAPPPPTVSALERLGLHGIEVEVGGTVQTGGGDSPVQAPTLWGSAGDAKNGGPQTLAPRGTLLDPGGASALGQYYAPYSFDPFAFWARVGWRFRRDLSVGLFFQFAQYLINSGADSGDAPDGTGRLSRQQVSAGVYVRYYVTHLLIPRLQPWISLGLGYNYDGASYSRPIAQATSPQPETGDYILQQHGLVVPAAIGLDVRLAPMFSLGPTVGYARVFPLKGCVEVDLDQFSQNGLQGQNTCASPPVQNQGYDNFFAGIYAKVTLDPFAR